MPRRLSSCFSNLTNLFLSFKFWWDTQKCTSSTGRLAANHLPFHSPARLADISSDPTDRRAVLLSVSFNWSYPLNNLHTNISLELLSNDIVLNALNTVDKAFSYIYIDGYRWFPENRQVHFVVRSRSTNLLAFENAWQKIKPLFSDFIFSSYQPRVMSAFS